MLFLKMTTTMAVETSVLCLNSDLIQDNTHPDDHVPPTFEMTPGLKHYASVNSTCAKLPPPPPGLLRGICPLYQSRGWGISKFCAARGLGICQSPGQTLITTQRILLEKQAGRLIFQGGEKIEEVCKGMFSILCMHFFIAYQARIT